MKPLYGGGIAPAPGVIPPPPRGNDATSKFTRINVIKGNK